MMSSEGCHDEVLSTLSSLSCYSFDHGLVVQGDGRASWARRVLRVIRTRSELRAIPHTQPLKSRWSSKALRRGLLLRHMLALHCCYTAIRPGVSNSGSSSHPLSWFPS